MKLILGAAASVIVFAASVCPQEMSREQTFQKMRELRGQLKTREKSALSPEAKDLALARSQGLAAIRILPKGKYDNAISLRGGGAYYSFARNTHEYGRGSDISLEGGNLSVGFAGADFGFLKDLGEIRLQDVNEHTAEVSFLVNYRPPADELEVRSEQRRSHHYDTDGLIFNRNLPAVAGHTYLLRSIVFDQSDLLVAFTIYRKEPDGSFTIFWKPIERFEIPAFRASQRMIEAQSAVSQVELSTEQMPERPARPDSVLLAECQRVLAEKGLLDVQVEVSNGVMTLRGTVPKGRLGEAVLTAQQTKPRQLINQLTEIK